MKNEKRNERSVLYAILRKVTSGFVCMSVISLAFNTYTLALLTDGAWQVFWILASCVCAVFAIYWMATPLAPIKRKRSRKRAVCIPVKRK